MRVRLYFFPAILPIVELMPWLLTAFGALAGFLVRAARGRSRAVRVGTAVFALAVLAATGHYLSLRLWLWWHRNDSHLTAAASLPALVSLNALPAHDTEEAPRAYAAGKAVQRWSVIPRRRALSRPLRAGGLYVVGTWEGTVDAHSLQDGTPLWTLRKQEPVFAMALASPSLLLAGEGLHDSPSATLTAVQLPDGKPLWQREFRGHIESAPAYSARLGAIWLGAGPGGLWSLKASNGAVAWHAEFGHVDSTPLLSEGDLLLFSSQPNEAVKASTFWALRAADGSVAWSLALPGQPWGSPQLLPGSGLVLASTGVGQVGVLRAQDRGWAHAISTVERKIVWTTELGGNPIEKGVLAGDLAIYVLTKGEVVALHARDGTEAWRRKLPGEVQADPELALGKLLAVIGTDGLLSLLDARTGALLETRSFTRGTGSAPLFLPDGMIVTSPYAHTRFRW